MRTFKVHGSYDCSSVSGLCEADTGLSNYPSTMSTIHRPCSSLAYSQIELSTQSFLSPAPFLLPSKAGRNAHTARALKALDMHTKLLAIPCAVEKHNLFTMCISAQLAAVQVSACNNLLEGHAESIAKDRIRLIIGYLKTLGTIWPLGKQMAQEVRVIARSSRPDSLATVLADVGPEATMDLPRDELIWPIDPSAQIDIYSGIVSSYASVGLKSTRC